MNLWWIPLYLRLLKSPEKTLFPPNPLGEEILRIWGQHKSVRLPDFGPWFHQSTGDFVGILKPTDLTLQAFLKGDTGWKTDGFSSLKVASQKAPPEKKCQNTQNMAFYDMCDIKSIYICNMCTFIYIYHIIYFICCRHPLFYKYHIFRTCYILDVRTYIYIRIEYASYSMFKQMYDIYKIYIRYQNIYRLWYKIHQNILIRYKM